MSEAPDDRAALFRWSNGAVVLLVERDGETWIVARGWRDQDRLIDVRRWTFDDRRRATGQIRRLVRESSDEATANAVAHEFAAWLESHISER